MQSSCVLVHSLESLPQSCDAHTEKQIEERNTKLAFLKQDENLNKNIKSAMESLVFDDYAEMVDSGVPHETIQEVYDGDVVNAKKAWRDYRIYKAKQKVKAFLNNKFVSSLLFALGLALLLNAFFVIGTEKEMFDKYYGGIFETQEEVDSIRAHCNSLENGCVFGIVADDTVE